MSTDSTPFLLKYWWLPPAVLAVGAVVAAWIYREAPIQADSFSAQLLQSTDLFEAGLDGPPAQRVEYRAEVSIEVHGQRGESTVHHVVEHIGGGWIRRTDLWHDGGAPRSTYQERYVSHRNLVQVFRQHREMAPFVHDLLDEFGWLTDNASAQSIEVAGRFPQEEGSALSVRQSRTAPTDPHSLVPKASPYERNTECRRNGTVDGKSFGSALSGQLIQVTCSLTRSDLPGETTNVFVWEPNARVFLLVNSKQPATLGGVEIQTRRIVALSIVP